MKKLLLVVIIGFLGQQIYTKYQSSFWAIANQLSLPTMVNKPTPQKKPSPSPAFKCDGRTYCSQMTSCAEATFFLRNCPNVKMDGDNDGVPCEQQWCGQRGDRRP